MDSGAGVSMSELYRKQCPVGVILVPGGSRLISLYCGRVEDDRVCCVWLSERVSSLNQLHMLERLHITMSLVPSDNMHAPGHVHVPLPNAVERRVQAYNPGSSLYLLSELWKISSIFSTLSNHWSLEQQLDHIDLV